jgi:hypothetical protein
MKTFGDFHEPSWRTANDPLTTESAQKSPHKWVGHEGSRLHPFYPSRFTANDRRFAAAGGQSATAASKPTETTGHGSRKASGKSAFPELSFATFTERARLLLAQHIGGGLNPP